jgi:hypothetical protein
MGYYAVDSEDVLEKYCTIFWIPWTTENHLQAIDYQF